MRISLRARQTGSTSEHVVVSDTPSRVRMYTCALHDVLRVRGSSRDFDLTIHTGNASPNRSIKGYVRVYGLTGYTRHRVSLFVSFYIFRLFFLFLFFFSWTKTSVYTPRDHTSASIQRLRTRETKNGVFVISITVYLRRFSRNIKKCHPEFDIRDGS